LAQAAGERLSPSVPPAEIGRNPYRDRSYSASRSVRGVHQAHWLCGDLDSGRPTEPCNVNGGSSHPSDI